MRLRYRRPSCVHLTKFSVSLLFEWCKDVYVEWPRYGTTDEAKYLAQMAKKKGVWTIIGFESLISHVHYYEGILDSGRIGWTLPFAHHFQLHFPRDGEPTGQAAEIWIMKIMIKTVINHWYHQFLPTYQPNNLLGPKITSVVSKLQTRNKKT